MFNFFKRKPIQKLENLRAKKLEEAMHLQRSGNLRLYADKVVEISKIEKKISELEKVTKLSDPLIAPPKKEFDNSRNL